MASSTEMKRTNRKLSIQQSIITKLLHTKPRPHAILQRKLESMEELIVELSECDCSSSNQDLDRTSEQPSSLFHSWKDKIAQLWMELYETDEIDLEDRITLSKNNTNKHKDEMYGPRAPMLLSRPRIVYQNDSTSSKIINDKSFSAIIAHLKLNRKILNQLCEYRQSLMNIPSISSHSSDGLQQLMQLSDEVYNFLKKKILLGTKLHLAMLSLATSKLPHFMVTRFEAIGKQSLRILANFLYTQIQMEHNQSPPSQLRRDSSVYSDDDVQEARSSNKRISSLITWTKEKVKLSKSIKNEVYSQLTVAILY